MLTKRQQQLLDFLHQYQTENGLMPSTRDIQKHFGFASQTAAVSHLRALERKGAIKRLPGKARAVVFPESLLRKQVVDIPIYGQIPAGLAADQTQESDGQLSVDIASLGISRNAKTFALKVRGESMIDAHICDGDFVVLEIKDPRNGDVVAALIDNESTLKRYIHQAGRPYLKAENKNFPDIIPARELIIQGVMVGLVRRGQS